jgi:anti-sigma factor RsiW
MKYRDVEYLSAYLDGQLNPSDSARLESRLKTDPELAAVMDDLRLARGLLHKLPSRRAPRSFTLTPHMRRLNAPIPRAYPPLRFASIFAALLFFISYAANLVTPRLAAEPMPVYGYGMGGGGGGSEESLATEAPALESPSMQKQPPATEAPFAAQDATRVIETPAPTGGLEGSATAAQPEVRKEAPLFSSWQIAFGVSAVVLGLLGWFVRLMSERSFRKKIKG